MKESQKNKLSKLLKQTLKHSRIASASERELAELTEQLFGYNWSEIDADGIIDSLAGFGSTEMTVEEFIDEMERSIKMKEQ